MSSNCELISSMQSPTDPAKFHGAADAKKNAPQCDNNKENESPVQSPKSNRRSFGSPFAPTPLSPLHPITLLPAASPTDSRRVSLEGPGENPDSPPCRRFGFKDSIPGPCRTPPRTQKTPAKAPPKPNLELSWLDADLSEVEQKLRFMTAQGMLATLNRAALKEVCKRLGLPVSGKRKEDFIQRIVAEVSPKGDGLHSPEGSMHSTPANMQCSPVDVPKSPHASPAPSGPGSRVGDDRTVVVDGQLTCTDRSVTGMLPEGQCPVPHHAPQGMPQHVDVKPDALQDASGAAVEVCGDVVAANDTEVGSESLSQGESVDLGQEADEVEEAADATCGQDPMDTGCVGDVDDAGPDAHHKSSAAAAEGSDNLAERIPAPDAGPAVDSAATAAELEGTQLGELSVMPLEAQALPLAAPAVLPEDMAVDPELVAEEVEAAARPEHTAAESGQEVGVVDASAPPQGMEVEPGVVAVAGESTQPHGVAVEAEAVVGNCEAVCGQAPQVAIEAREVVTEGEGVQAQPQEEGAEPQALVVGSESVCAKPHEMVVEPHGVAGEDKAGDTQPQVPVVDREGVVVEGQAGAVESEDPMDDALSESSDSADEVSEASMDRSDTSFKMCDSSSDNSDDSTSDSDAGSVPRPARKPRATMAHLPDCNAQSDAAQTACGRARALSLSSFKPDTSWLEGPAPAVRQRLQAFMAQGLLGTLGIATLREASKGLGLPQPKRKEDLLVQLQAELGREDAGPSAPEEDCTTPEVVVEVTPTASPMAQAVPSPAAAGAQATTQEQMESVESAFQRVSALRTAGALPGLSIAALRQACRDLQLPVSCKRKEELVARLEARLCGTSMPTATEASDIDDMPPAASPGLPAPSPQSSALPAHPRHGPLPGALEAAAPQACASEAVAAARAPVPAAVAPSPAALSFAQTPDEVKRGRMADYGMSTYSCPAPKRRLLFGDSDMCAPPRPLPPPVLPAAPALGPLPRVPSVTASPISGGTARPPVAASPISGGASAAAVAALPIASPARPVGPAAPPPSPAATPQSGYPGTPGTPGGVRADPTVWDGLYAMASQGLLKTLSVGALRDVSKRLNFPVAGMKKDQLLERLEDGIAGAMRAREETVVTPLRSGAPSDMVEGEDGDDGLQAAAEAQAEGRPVRGRGREREAEAAEEVQCVGMKREREEEGEGEGDCVKRLRGMSPERPEAHAIAPAPSPPPAARYSRPGLCNQFRMADFDARAEIGQGTQATVYKTKFIGKGKGGAGSGLEVGQVVCLKEFMDVDQGRREVHALHGLMHPNVLRCYGSFETPRALYLVLELCSHDLTKVVSARPRSPAYLDYEERRRLLYKVALGLQYLHSEDVLHCDLKLENVMVGLNGEPKICDFGLAQPFRGRALTECVGTIFNMAPEVFDSRSHGYGEKYSTWQFGIIIAQVMWGSEDDLFDRGYEWPMRAIVGLQYTLPDEDLDFPDDAITRDLLKRHIMVSEKDRYTIDQLLQHPFFTGCQ